MSRIPRWNIRIAVLCLLLVVSVASAGVTLAPVFGDHMVLQREKPLPVWGRATPGASITAQFAGQTKTATADREGNWTVIFNKMPASKEGRTLAVTGDGDTKKISDILVGDVWLCAGQSNMEFRLRDDAFAKAALAEADVPNLRLDLWHYGTQWTFAGPFTPAQAETLAPEKFYTNQWQASAAQSAREFSAIGWYFGRELQQKLGVPVGMISLAAGGSPAEAWTRRAAIEADPQLRPMAHGNWLENKALDDWCRQRGHQNLDKPIADGLPVPSAPFPDLGPNHAFKPAMLWDAGMARIIPFAVAGVLWYQGESNSLAKRRVEQHERLFPLLVRDWRAQWRQGDFPFYYVQLSGISTGRGYKSQFWPEFRDSQRRFQEILPNVGMAVSSDLGAEFDVHPRDKRDVAQRLARIALAKTYGQRIEYSGPAPRALRRSGSAVALTFDHAAGLKTSDGKEPRGFEVAGKTGDFHPATARIEGGGVLLSSPDVPAPERVRYAWQPFPDANLVNSDDLPASTFQIALDQR